MAELRRKGDIDTSEDEEFERREWKVQRVAWAIMFLFVAAGAAGLFGSGPLAHANAGSAAAGLALKYERFARQQAPTELELEVRPTGEHAELWLSRSFLDAVEVESIHPEPDEIDVHADRLVYRWRAGEGAGLARVVFEVQHTRMGNVTGQAGGPDGSTLTFTQLVYP